MFFGISIMSIVFVSCTKDDTDVSNFKNVTVENQKFKKEVGEGLINEYELNYDLKNTSSNEFYFKYKTLVGDRIVAAENIVRSVEGSGVETSEGILKYANTNYNENYGISFQENAEAYIINNNISVNKLEEELGNQLSNRAYYYLYSLETAAFENNNELFLSLLNEYENEISKTNDIGLKSLSTIFATISFYKDQMLLSGKKSCGKAVLSGAATGAVSGFVRGAFFGFIAGGPAGAAAGGATGAVYGAIIGVGVSGIKCESGLQWPWED